MGPAKPAISFLTGSWVVQRVPRVAPERWLAWRRGWRNPPAPLPRSALLASLRGGERRLRTETSRLSRIVDDLARKINLP